MSTGTTTAVMDSSSTSEIDAALTGMSFAEACVLAL